MNAGQTRAVLIVGLALEATGLFLLGTTLLIPVLHTTCAYSECNPDYVHFPISWIEVDTGFGLIITGMIVHAVGFTPAKKIVPKAETN